MGTSSVPGHVESTPEAAGPSAVEPDRVARRARLIELLGDARVRFWVCPVAEHRDHAGAVSVEWDGDVARCAFPGCHLTSHNVRRARCTNDGEHLDFTATRCDGFLTFPPGDVQAKCDTCGVWCGAQVADYLDAPQNDPRAT